MLRLRRAIARIEARRNDPDSATDFIQRRNVGRGTGTAAGRSRSQEGAKAFASCPVLHCFSEIEFRGNSAPLFVYSVPFVVNIAPAIPHPFCPTHSFTDSLTRSFSSSSLILKFAFFSFRRFFLLIDLCLNRASMNDTCNRQSAQCGPVNTGPWIADLSHRISHSSHSSPWSHWLLDQASQTLDVRPRMHHSPSFAGDRLNVKAPSRTSPNADPMHRQHRHLLRKPAKEAGTNLENESKNPDKSGKIRTNPGKSG